MVPSFGQVDGWRYPHTLEVGIIHGDRKEKSYLALPYRL
jgi:hypothetical protein